MKRQFLKKTTKKKTYTYTWKDNQTKNEDINFEINPQIVTDKSNVKAKIEKPGLGKIIDDDRDPKDDLPETYDPIVIDFNKNGITSTRLDNTVYFDHDNNGFKEATAWIEKDDGLLALDKNGNGKIDNGNELFGDKTVSVGAYGYTGKTAENGFEALKEFDSNSDNVIDEKDKDFDKLLLWQDLNTNGLTEEGELKTLKEHNIKSIDLRYKETQIDNNGNLIKQTSTVTFNDNTTTTADDVWFKVDLRYTEQPSINIPERIKALPEVTAFGNLHNLRNAMSENLGLENMIKDYMGLSLEEKVKQLDSILFKWAGVEGNACIKASPNRHYG